MSAPPSRRSSAFERAAALRRPSVSADKGFERARAAASRAKKSNPPSSKAASRWSSAIAAPAPDASSPRAPSCATHRRRAGLSATRDAAPTSGRRAERAERAFTVAVRRTPPFFAHFAASNERVDDDGSSRRRFPGARCRRAPSAPPSPRRRVARAPPRERARAASAAAGCVQTTARRRDARTTVAGRRTRRPRAERATRRTPTRDDATRIRIRIRRKIPSSEQTDSWYSPKSWRTPETPRRAPRRRRPRGTRSTNVRSLLFHRTRSSLPHRY